MVANLARRSPEVGGRSLKYPTPCSADSPAPPGSAELPGLPGSVPPHWGGVAGDGAGHGGSCARCPRGGARGCAHHHPGPPQLLCDSRPCRTGWQESAGAEACGQGEVPTPPTEDCPGRCMPSSGTRPSALSPFSPPEARSGNTFCAFTRLVLTRLRHWPIWFLAASNPSDLKLIPLLGRSPGYPLPETLKLSDTVMCHLMMGIQSEKWSLDNFVFVQKSPLMQT